METIPAVAVLIIKDHKVLLVKHGEASGNINGVYGLPAGRLQKGETEKASAVRELSEETGLIILEDDLIEYHSNIFTGEVKRKGGKAQLYAMKVFVCHNFSGELQSSDETEPEWVDISRLHEYDLLPNVKDAVMREVAW